jgi:hypothetical protein
MRQLGFFGAEKQLSALSTKGDPLEAITALVTGEFSRRRRGGGLDVGGGEEEHGRP